MAERPLEPWPGLTYGGFAGARPGGGSRPSRLVSGPFLIGGLALAVLLGTVLGLAAQPELAEPVDREPMQAVALPTLPIEVAAAAPEPPAPVPAEKLEVLPADMARAAEARAGTPAEPEQTPRPAQVDAEPAEPAPPPPAPPPRLARAPGDPSFDCRHARTFSEELVCGDRELARLDRRLAGAFDRALRAGAPFWLLRAEQDDWLAVREDAARYSRRAVANIYRQRIRELEAISDDLGD